MLGASTAARAVTRQHLTDDIARTRSLTSSNGAKNAICRC